MMAQDPHKYDGTGQTGTAMPRGWASLHHAELWSSASCVRECTPKSTSDPTKSGAILSLSDGVTEITV